MTARVPHLLLVVALAACASATPTVDPGIDTTATIRVFQEQRSCCYIEGQVSYLAVAGEEHEFRLTRVGVVPLVELEVPIGRFDVESWQRPCDGNCGSLDPPVNQCSMAVDPGPGETVRLLVSFDPGPDPCDLTMLEDDPPTTVPLDYGLRTPLPSCGEDFTMQMAMFGEVEVESPERRCFVDGYLAGEPAELAAYVPPDPNAATDDILDLITYRTQPEQPIEVFVNVGPEFEEWLFYRCEALTEVQGPALFTLEGCEEPQPIE
ncbi:MAG: hypothetical protein ACRDZM_18065 [Acidimicrobiia bacterium]